MCEYLKCQQYKRQNKQRKPLKILKKKYYHLPQNLMVYFLKAGRILSKVIGLRMSLWSWSEYVELSGMVNCPLTMAKACSPNGVLKKHSLYSKHPRAYIHVLYVCAYEYYLFVITTA
jgi:hypothetical protein